MDIKIFTNPHPTPPSPNESPLSLDAANALRRKDQELLKKYDELAQAIFIDMFGDPVRNEDGRYEQSETK
ncbi:MAG: hypothetical protein IPO98_18810 [Saprospiraceae bacterium]|nr:hypothetical protein [Saprospiraceae bacterium]